MLLSIPMLPSLSYEKSLTALFHFVSSDTIVQQLSKPYGERTLGKNEAKAYYSSQNPGSVFRRLGKRADDANPGNGGKEVRNYRGDYYVVMGF